MSNWQMYWLMMLDNISSLVIGIALAVGIVLVVAILARIIVGDDDEDVKGVACKCMRFTVPILIVMAPLAALIPTTKQMAVIVVVPKIINNKEVQEMPEKLVELANGWMEEKVKELNEDSDD